MKAGETPHFWARGNLSFVHACVVDRTAHVAIGRTQFKLLAKMNETELRHF